MALAPFPKPLGPIHDRRRVWTHHAERMDRPRDEILPGTVGPDGTWAATGNGSGSPPVLHARVGAGPRHRARHAAGPVVGRSPPGRSSTSTAVRTAVLARRIEHDEGVELRSFGDFHLARSPATAATVDDRRTLAAIVLDDGQRAGARSSSTRCTCCSRPGSTSCTPTPWPSCPADRPGELTSLCRRGAVGGPRGRGPRPGYRPEHVDDRERHRTMTPRSTR